MSFSLFASSQRRKWDGSNWAAATDADSQQSRAHKGDQLSPSLQFVLRNADAITLYDCHFLMSKDKGGGWVVLTMHWVPANLVTALC